MFTHPFHPDRFLRSVCCTDVFEDYCQARNIPFKQNAAARVQMDDARRWAAALAELSQERHAQIELELATVNEMAGADALAHLLEAVPEGETPPDSVPTGAPLALWFLLHHPVLFHEVFLHLEILEVESWRRAHAPPGIALADLDAKATTLASALRAFFRIREGTGRFCTVDAHRLTDSVCFIAHIADRLQFLDVFTEDGRRTSRKVRPAIPILFAYFPADGRVLLKSHLRSRDRTSALFGCFGQAALGSPVSCDNDAFDLDILKRPFHPLPDALIIAHK